MRWVDDIKTTTGLKWMKKANNRQTWKADLAEKVNVTPNLQIEISNLKEIQDSNEDFVEDKMNTDNSDSENTDFDYNTEDLVEDDTDYYEIAKSENKGGEIYEITIEDEGCQEVHNIDVNRETDESNENQEARPRILYLESGYKVL
ncbi:hypothetical protein FQA39_LY09309 [Lamprigera yunnana]|nr:hypothetical protein FQA39_LY09309 [Lamprigera yunnana]